MQSKMNKEDKSAYNKKSHESFLDILDIFKEHHKVSRNLYEAACLHIAAIKGNISIIKYMLEHCEYDPNILNEESKTILHIAVVQENFALVHYLVTDKHLDPLSHRDVYGWSPFHYACASGNLDIIQYFISAMDHSLNSLLDALLIHYKNNAFSGFHVAIANGRARVVEYFTANASHEVIGDSLSLVLAVEKPSILKFLLSTINYSDVDRHVALFAAAITGQLSSVYSFVIFISSTL